MPRSSLKSYSGAKASAISFPLGGIGSGCIGLGGDGRLIDWEIFNKPAKSKRNGFSHFAVRASAKGKLLDARVLNAELRPPYTGNFGCDSDGGYSGFGFGVASEAMGGFPNFRKAVFTGEFPFAEIQFSDPAFPGKVKLRAFNPCIPLNDKDSSIPAAFFEIEFFNSSKEKIDYSAAFTVKNPAAEGVNRKFEKDGLKGIFLKQADPRPAADDPAFGDMAFATDAEDAFCQESWFRGTWCDHLEVYWREFASVKGLTERHYEDKRGNEHGTIMASVSLKPKERKSVRFVVSWNYPNYANFQPEKTIADEKLSKSWRNYYSTLFKDALESASYSMKSWERLEGESELFRKALHSSSLPQSALEAVSANISILKTPTCLRLADGSFWGWEGLHSKHGSCEGTCTHVWNYAYAMPFLFPKLERSIRELNYKYNLRPDGGMAFRLLLPLGERKNNMRPCADGQFGDVVKVYREWKICGDDAWMKRLWPSVKKSVEYAWSPENKDKWDPKKTGVLRGRQHHTLDVELFGASSWLGGFYLAALKAGAEMAEAAGEPETAKEYREIFKRGKDWVDKNLFNGEWYIQKIDLSDKSLLEETCKEDAQKNNGKYWYWNDEHKEIKYQIGEGSEIDQVLAQWHANLCGLGDIFDKKQRRRALKSIYKHNFVKEMRAFPNTFRVFSLYDEAGVVICVWPKGVRKPVVPIPYNPETMYGFEHSAAALMIQEGMVEEGAEIEKLCRARFDGERRNPWNEYECGSNYARSMASYSLLNAFSGFEFDMSRKTVGFNPVEAKTACKFFWSLDSGWGLVEFAKGKVALKVLRGSLELSEFRSARIAKALTVKLGGKRVKFSSAKGAVKLESKAKLLPGENLEVEFQG